MTGFIEELEARIAAKRQELEDEENALATVKRMMKQPQANKAHITAKEQTGSIKFEDLIGDEKKKRTLIDEVRDVVLRFGENEFTVAHIEAALKKLGVVIDAKNPRARIGIAITPVVNEGLIVMTEKGGGNVPHRYKLKAAVGSDMA